MGRILGTSSPWENIVLLWQHLRFYCFKLNKPNLTLPNKFSIPYPDPAMGSLPQTLNK